MVPIGSPESAPSYAGPPSLRQALQRGWQWVARAAGRRLIPLGAWHMPQLGGRVVAPQPDAAVGFESQRHALPRRHLNRSREVGRLGSWLRSGHRTVSQQAIVVAAPGPDSAP